MHKNCFLNHLFKITRAPSLWMGMTPLYLVVVYQWWLCQVDVHMAEMYGKKKTDDEHY